MNEWPWSNPRSTLPAFLPGCTLLQSRCANRQMKRGLKCMYSSSTLHRTYRFSNQPTNLIYCCTSACKGKSHFPPSNLWLAWKLQFFSMQPSVAVHTSQTTRTRYCNALFGLPLESDWELQLTRGQNLSAVLQVTTAT